MADGFHYVSNRLRFLVVLTFHAYRYTQTGRATDGVCLDRRSLWLSATYDF
jgi:hypothetical protein